jgi:hypothetical protein
VHELFGQRGVRISRIEAIAKSLDLPLAASGNFALARGGALKSLGRHQLRGLDLPHELFTPASLVCRANAGRICAVGHCGHA